MEQKIDFCSVGRLFPSLEKCPLVEKEGLATIGPIPFKDKNVNLISDSSGLHLQGNFRPQSVCLSKLETVELIFCS